MFVTYMKKGISIFKVPERFLRCLPEISLCFSFLNYFVKLKHPEDPTRGLNVLSLCIHMAEFHPSSHTLSRSLSAAPLLWGKGASPHSHCEGRGGLYPASLHPCVYTPLIRCINSDTLQAWRKNAPTPIPSAVYLLFSWSRAHTHRRHKEIQAPQFLPNALSYQMKDTAIKKMVFFSDWCSYCQILAPIKCSLAIWSCAHVATPQSVLPFFNSFH